MYFYVNLYYLFLLIYFSLLFILFPLFFTNVYFIQLKFKLKTQSIQVRQEAQARQVPTSLQKARYERYIPLTANRTTILEEAFDLEVPVRLPQMKSLRPGSDATKYCRFHRGIEHNTKDCWALNGKSVLVFALHLSHFCLTW